jgi:hypothetical protein
MYNVKRGCVCLGEISAPGSNSVVLVLTAKKRVARCDVSSAMEKEE